jgi:ribose transport system substrate-binding protein
MIAATPVGAQSPSVPPDADQPLDITLLTTYNGLPFYTAMYCGALDAALEQGNVNVTSEGPPRGMNVADQLPILQAVTNARPDGIIFVPADPRAMIPPVQDAVDAGIPLVTTDAVLAEPVALAQFHADNIAGGAMAAEEMKRLLEGQAGPILVLDNRPGLPVTNERAEGFVQAMEGSAFEILPVEFDEDDPNQAATIVQATLGRRKRSDRGAPGFARGCRRHRVRCRTNPPACAP